MSKRTSKTHHLNSLKNELLMILRYYLAWKRLVQFQDFHRISREEFVDKLISIKCIENDLLMRITKLVDNDKRVHSFNNLINELKSTQYDREKLSNLFSSLSEKIKDLKKRRNEVLAHLKIGEIDEYMPNYDFALIIQLLVEIVDEISNQEVVYSWSDGSKEKYDLRKIL